MWKWSSIGVAVFIVVGTVVIWRCSLHDQSTQEPPNFWGRVLVGGAKGVSPADGVILRLGEHVAVSDTQGYFAFYRVDQGTYELSIEGTSRPQHSLTVQVLAKQPRWPDIVLNPQPATPPQHHELGNTGQPPKR